MSVSVPQPQVWEAFHPRTRLPPAAREALIRLHLIPITPSLGPALPTPNSVMSLVVRAQPQPGSLPNCNASSPCGLATETGLSPPTPETEAGGLRVPRGGPLGHTPALPGQRLLRRGTQDGGQADWLPVCCQKGRPPNMCQSSRGWRGRPGRLLHSLCLPSR